MILLLLETFTLLFAASYIVLASATAPSTFTVNLDLKSKPFIDKLAPAAAACPPPPNTVARTCAAFVSPPERNEKLIIFLSAI